MSGIHRILCKWFPDVFDALRQEDIIDTTNSSVHEFHERSHILAIFEKSGLITILGGRPVRFRATEELFKYNNDDLLRLIKCRVPVGAIFKTPVDKIPHIVVEWGKDRNGDERIRHKSISDCDANTEQERQKYFGEIESRPEQQQFSAQLQHIYGNKCAITGCETPAALQAAHIKPFRDGDKPDNRPENGILLRADIHAMFDALLFTLSEDGSRLDVSDDVTDPTYAFLRKVKVASPTASSPSKENIRHHRERFLERKRRGKDTELENNDFDNVTD